MLQQSQTQYMALDRKYNKAKRLVREYQQRELDMVHHEEFYLSLLQEKDTEYNALVKKLKDRVINLEQELQDTQRKAGLPVSLPYDSASLRLTPQMSRRQPPKPLFQKLDTGLSDTEVSDLSPDGEDDKTATVERKLPVKDELDSVVPPHELLDSSALKSKSDLASRGAKRQLPTGKKSLSNSSSDCALNESEEEGARTDSSSSKGESGRQNGFHRNRPDENPTPLYAQVHKDRSQDAHHHTAHSTIPNIYKNSSEQNSSYSNDLNSSYDSILGSNDKLSDNGQNPDSWMYPSRRRGVKVPPNSFTDQLNQVLSDREK